MIPKSAYPIDYNNRDLRKSAIKKIKKSMNKFIYQLVQGLQATASLRVRKKWDSSGGLSMLGRERFIGALIAGERKRCGDLGCQGSWGRDRSPTVVGSEKSATPSMAPSSKREIKRTRDDSVIRRC